MTQKTSWPGQIERIEFDLAQVTAIASVARAEVFWAFNTDKPLSAADVAAAIGKSAQTVRYHVNELLKVGLIIVAETRKRRSRTEEAYVHKAHGNFTSRPPFSRDYSRQMIRGYRALIRSMSIERSALIQLERVDPEMNVYNALRYWTLHLTPEGAERVKQRLHGIIEELEKEQCDEGLRVHIATYMSTTLSETQALYQKLTGQGLTSESEEVLDGDE